MAVIGAALFLLGFALGVVAMSRTKVTVRDRGWKALLQRVQDWARAPGRVRVGVLDDTPKDAHDGKPGSASLVEVAAIHEFGAPAANIPERSFIRATVDIERDEIQKLQGAVARRVVKDAITARQGLGQIGAKVVAMMRRRIRAGIAPPLQPATIERKGSSKPLIDTRQLVSSLTWKVAA